MAQLGKEILRPILELSRSREPGWNVALDATTHLPLTEEAWLE